MTTVTDATDVRAELAAITERLAAMELLLRVAVLTRLDLPAPDSPAGPRLVGSLAGPPEGR